MKSQIRKTLFAGLMLGTIIGCSANKKDESTKPTTPLESTGIWTEKFIGPISKDENGHYYMPTRFITKFYSPESKLEMDSYAKDIGGRITGVIPQLNSCEVEISGNLDGAIEAMSKKNNVEYAVRNYFYQPAATQWDNDKFISDGKDPNNGLWWVDRIMLSDGLDLFENANRFKRTTIAIVDVDGFDLDNSEIPYTDRIYHWDFGDADNDVSSPVLHGTQTAILAAAMNNGIGTNGVATTRTGRVFNILPIKILSTDWLKIISETMGQLILGDQFRAAAALSYIAETSEKTGVKVVNMSFSYFINPIQYNPFHKPNALVDEAIQNLGKKNIIPVASAGNDGADACYSLPSSINGVISVGSTKYVMTNGAFTEMRAESFSNYSDKTECLEVCAPGDNILVISENNEYILSQGTSYSAPMVTGLVALIKSMKPDATYDEIVKILRDNSDDIVLDNDPVDEMQGKVWKRINVKKTIEYMTKTQ